MPDTGTRAHTRTRAHAPAHPSSLTYSYSLACSYALTYSCSLTYSYSLTCSYSPSTCFFGVEVVSFRSALGVSLRSALVSGRGGRAISFRSALHITRDPPQSQKPSPGPSKTPHNPETLSKRPTSLSSCILIQHDPTECAKRLIPRGIFNTTAGVSG